MRKWRDANRKAINVRRRDRAAERTEEQRANDSARSALAVYLARGKAQRSKCHTCGTRDNVTAYQADPARPLDVIWLCREDRFETIIRVRREAEVATQRDAWAERRQHALERLAHLPPEQQAAIRATAARGPAGIILEPTAPLYLQRLVLTIEQLAT